MPPMSHQSSSMTGQNVSLLHKTHFEECTFMSNQQETAPNISCLPFKESCCIFGEKIEFEVTCISEHQSSRPLLDNYSTQTGAVNSLRASLFSDKQRKGGWK